MEDIPIVKLHTRHSVANLKMEFRETKKRKKLLTVGISKYDIIQGEIEDILAEIEQLNDIDEEWKQKAHAANKQLELSRVALKKLRKDALSQPTM